MAGERFGLYKVKMECRANTDSITDHIPVIVIQARASAFTMHGMRTLDFDSVIGIGGIGGEAQRAGIAGRLRGLESDRTGRSGAVEARGSMLRKISSIVDKDFLDKTVPEAMERSQVEIRHFARASLGRFESRLPEKS